MLQHNIQKALWESKMSIAELARISDLPLDTVKNIYYGRVKDPKTSSLFAISKALGVSINCLLGDFTLSRDEERLLFNYRNSSERGKAVTLLFSKIEKQLTEEERNGDKFIISCLIPIGIIKDGVHYNSCDSTKIECTNPEAYLGIEITTNNFAPAYCKGDRILLANRFPREKERAVFLANGYAYFREFHSADGGYILTCLNGRGEDIYLRRMDEVDCIGTLVGVVRA